MEPRAVAMLAEPRMAVQLHRAVAARCLSVWPISRVVRKQTKKMKMAKGMTISLRLAFRAFWVGKTTNNNNG